jgi:hypothetical protein
MWPRKMGATVVSNRLGCRMRTAAVGVARSVRVAVRLTPEEAAELDRRRRGVSRSEYARRVLTGRVEAPTQEMPLVAEPVPLPVQSVPAPELPVSAALPPPTVGRAPRTAPGVAVTDQPGGPQQRSTPHRHTRDTLVGVQYVKGVERREYRCRCGTLIG